MSKILLILLLVIAVLLVSRKFGKRTDKVKARDARRAAKATTDAAGDPLQMVACAHCGVYIPRGEALLPDAAKPDAESHAEARYFCTPAHRDQARG